MLTTALCVCVVVEKACNQGQSCVTDRVANKCSLELSISSNHQT